MLARLARVERGIHGSALFATHETLCGKVRGELLNAYEILINRARFWVMGFCVSLCSEETLEKTRFSR